MTRALARRDFSLTMIAVIAFSAIALAGALARPLGRVHAESATGNYIVVLAGVEASDGSFAVGGSDELNLGAARALIEAAGGSITRDLSGQIGVILASSASSSFVDTLRSSALVEAVGQDWGWKQYATLDEGLASGEVSLVTDDASAAADGTADPFEPLQWSMIQIHAPEAHAFQAGSAVVDVGILDTGIDGTHPDFTGSNGWSNVDCARGHNSITFVVAGGPGVGVANPCIDNAFHGTHVAGIVAARANGIGVVGVAPDVTLVPVKVCDSSGYCYAGAVVDGITYAGDQRLDVTNMSFFVDDDGFQESTEFKCRDDATQAAFRRAVERALKYARSQGVAQIAALGNSDQDLNNPVDANDQPISDRCEVVPAESAGVVGVTALGPDSGKASYSNYGDGPAEVAAPGGTSTGDCTRGVLSTFPVALGGYGCISGTSMASPHAAGVAALIVSQYGRIGRDGDVQLSHDTVAGHLAGTAIDIGLPGYDECFGNGRIDALRAVQGDTSAAYDASAPYCPEYSE